MNNPLIQFVKRYCIRIAFVAILIIVLANQIWPHRISSAHAYNAIIGVFAGLYFVHKQNIEDIKLFHDLFEHFNLRYDELHNDMLAMHGMTDFSNDPTLGSQAEKYLNLCAEEYFYYCQDVIYRDVWASWCRGMVAHLAKSQALSTLWGLEIEKPGRNNSYYGLSSYVVEQHAKR